MELQYLQKYEGQNAKVYMTGYYLEGKVDSVGATYLVLKKINESDTGVKKTSVYTIDPSKISAIETSEKNDPNKA